MEIEAQAALVFAPLVVPLCLWTAWSDLSAMRIPNRTVLILAGVFVIAAPFLMPLDAYLWRLATAFLVLVAGILLNAGGALGAGDAKFMAAAATFIAPGDLRLLVAIFAANLLGAWCTHRLAMHSPLRRLAPGWESWHRGTDFPMGLALGSTLTIYLLAGVFFGR